MLRVAQALGVWFFAGVRLFPLNSAVLLCASLALSACASGGFSLKQAEIDRTLYTSDIPADAKRPLDAGPAADQATIRNAVSSADIESLGGVSVPWANSETGARGSITELAEYKDNSLLCRRFTTTRESFDGVGLFKGETCMASAGAWRMQSFEAL